MCNLFSSAKWLSLAPRKSIENAVIMAVKFILHRQKNHKQLLEMLLAD